MNEDIRVGDIITADCPQGREIDPLTHQPTGRLIKFVVDAVVDEAGSAAYKLTPLRRKLATR